MPRAGSGSGGGSHHSSGGHSVGRSSGGHHVSSSRPSGSSSHSRAGSGTSFGSYSKLNRSSSPYRPSPPPPRPVAPMHMGGYTPPPPPIHHTTVYTSSPRSSRNHGSNIWAPIIAILILFSIVICLLSGSSEPTSSYAREKLNLGIAFDNDCIVDELDWFDNVTKSERNLEHFYEKTGVQPYIYLKAYDSSLQTEEQKEDWANNWYENNIDNEGTFLFVYFAEQDQDNDVGYMCYVNGTQVASMMDAEALEIFWNYIDTYWYSDMSTDDLFTTVFTKTADTITVKSKTTTDVVWVFACIALVATAGIVVCVVITKKRKAEAEKAKETERILNTPLDDLGGHDD